MIIHVKNLSGHFCNNDSSSYGSIERLCHAASYARDSDRMRDARQNVSPDAMRLASDDENAFCLGLQLE